MGAEGELRNNSLRIIDDDVLAWQPAKAKYLVDLRVVHSLAIRGEQSHRQCAITGM